MRDNIKEQCRKLHVNEMLTREIMGDVFGERSGDLKIRTSLRALKNYLRLTDERRFKLCLLFLAGLIDSTPDDYDEEYSIMESKCESHSPEGKAFADYFQKYKLQEIKRTMLLSLRVGAGLGLDVYTQNAS